MELGIGDQLPELVYGVRFQEPLRLIFAPRMTPVPTATATGTMPKFVGLGREAPVEVAEPEENGVVRGLGVYVWSSFVASPDEDGGDVQCVQNVGSVCDEPP
jgi:hypothetical protein